MELREDYCSLISRETVNSVKGLVSFTGSIPQKGYHGYPRKTTACRAPGYMIQQTAGLKVGARTSQTCFVCVASQWFRPLDLSRAKSWRPRKGQTRDAEPNCGVQRSRFLLSAMSFASVRVETHCVASSALAPACCLLRMLAHPRSQQQQWQQKQCQLLGCSVHSSAAPAPGCCLRRILEHPRSRQPQNQEWLQKHG